MILDLKKLLGFAVRKQYKISHVPCQALVFGKDELPEDIKKKIDEQYSADFLNDCDNVLFIRGPIDKDMLKKVFKATDKAFGGTDDDSTNSNKMVIGDFKLLKLTDDAEDIMPDENTDETPDQEVEDIVKGEDADSASVSGDEDTEDEMIKEAMSVADIIAKGKEIKARNDAEKKAADDAKAKAYEQKIKSIWIKSINIDPHDDKKSKADIQITYMDGEVKDDEFSVSTTGSDKNFIRDRSAGGYQQSGSRWQQGDASYEKTRLNLTRIFPRGIKPTDEDIRVALVRQAFNDWRIKWYYGKDKKNDPVFAFSREASPENVKAVSKIARLSKPKSWMDAPPLKAAIWKNGSTTIYRTNEDEDNSPAAMVHQGKSMAQWEKEFKGEFTIPQLVRMARSGTDLQRLLLTINGHLTIDDSEICEAKKEEKPDKTEDVENTQDTSDVSDEENKDDDNEDSEEILNEPENTSDEEAAEPEVKEEKPVVPTKWVFLKITFKK